MFERTKSALDAVARLPGQLDEAAAVARDATNRIEGAATVVGEDVGTVATATGTLVVILAVATLAALLISTVALVRTADR